MTKKDYEKFAKWLSDSRHLLGGKQYAGLMAIFLDDNPRFDIDRFCKAAGYPPVKGNYAAGAHLFHKLIV